MAIRNAHWYSRNEASAYPLDDIATATDHRQQRLPNNVLVDLNLRWPDTWGRYAFISSLTVTPTIVSLTIQTATTLDGETFAPLAVLAIEQPVEQGRQYKLDGQIPGVAGWVVFGRGVLEPYRGRFAEPRQGVLLARVARPYRALPVTGLRASDAGTALTGVVKLRAEAPLELVKESREIDGVVRDCAVLRLVEDAGTDGVIAVDVNGNPVTANETSVFRQFSGPCGGRPESGSCGDPQPIEFIDVVGPDCDGVVTLEFRGCADVHQIQGVCGVAIDCGLGLSEVCLPPKWPDSDGRLPSEYDAVVVPIPPDPDPDPVPDLSETIIESGSLPYADCFMDKQAQHFVTKNGLWNLQEDHTNIWLPCVGESLSDEATPENDAYAYCSNTTSGRCITVWDGFDFSTLGRTFQTDVKLMPGPLGAVHNAGAVINYRPHETQAGRFVYHYAEIDFDLQQVRLSRFNGSNMQVAVPVSVPGIFLNKWYRIFVTVTSTTGNTVTITVRFFSLEDGSVDVTIGPVGFNNFYPSDGLWGFGTDRSLARFSHIQLEMA